MMDSQIKSRERVRSLAEVYTRNEEINAMLDLIGDISHNIEARFLEPAAGNGNFLVRILERKLKSAVAKAKNHKRKLTDIQRDFEFYALMSVASIYAVDIDPSNVRDARRRLHDQIIEVYSGVFNTLRPNEGFYCSVEYILRRNIIEGDMINGVHRIQFTEFSSPKMYKFTQRIFLLSDILNPLMGAKPQPIQEIPMRNYGELGHV